MLGFTRRLGGSTHTHAGWRYTHRGGLLPYLPGTMIHYRYFLLHFNCCLIDYRQQLLDDSLVCTEHGPSLLPGWDGEGTRSEAREGPPREGGSREPALQEEPPLGGSLGKYPEITRCRLWGEAYASTSPPGSFRPSSQRAFARPRFLLLAEYLKGGVPTSDRSRNPHNCAGDAACHGREHTNAL